MKKALIIGISGQDGPYLAKHLLNQGYEVFGTSRDAQVSNFRNLIILGIREHVKLESMSLVDFRSVIQVIKKIKPDEIYNLAGQSSVGLSFDQPVETLESVTTATINILESIRLLEEPIKFYNASSSECFGNTPEPATEETPFNPRSPYAAAKAAAFWIVSNYREAYKLFASSGILFNHESPLRSERFVTQKIISGAIRIHKGSNEKLMLGNFKIIRDWGWAPEYVQAMHKLLQLERPTDLIIGTGESNSLEDFVSYTFDYLNLDWRKYCEIEQNLFRPSDLSISRANPSKAINMLNWHSKFKMKDIIKSIIDTKLGIGNE